MAHKYKTSRQNARLGIFVLFFRWCRKIGGRSGKEVEGCKGIYLYVFITLDTLDISKYIFFFSVCMQSNFTLDHILLQINTCILSIAIILILHSYLHIDSIYLSINGYCKPDNY